MGWRFLSLPARGVNASCRYSQPCSRYQSALRGWSSPRPPAAGSRAGGRPSPPEQVQAGASSCRASLRLRGRCRCVRRLTHVRPGGQGLQGAGGEHDAPDAGRAPRRRSPAAPRAWCGEPPRRRRPRPPPRGGWSAEHQELHHVLHVHQGQRAGASGELEQMPGHQLEEGQVLPCRGDPGCAAGGHRDLQPVGKGEGDALGLRLGLAVPLGGTQGIALHVGRIRGRGRPRRASPRAPARRAVPEATIASHTCARSLRVHREEGITRRCAPDPGQMEDDLHVLHRRGSVAGRDVAVHALCQPGPRGGVRARTQQAADLVAAAISRSTRK